MYRRKNVFNEIYYIVELPSMRCITYSFNPVEAKEILDQYKLETNKEAKAIKFTRKELLELNF